jgi:hypothetical protein
MEEYRFLLAQELKNRYYLPNKIVFSKLRWEKLKYLSQRRFNKPDLLDLLYFDFLRYNLKDRNLHRDRVFEEMESIITKNYGAIEKNRSILNLVFRIILIKSRLMKVEVGTQETLDSNIISMFSSLYHYHPEQFNLLLNIVSELYFFMAQQFQVDYFCDLKLYYLIHPELLKT